jgi:hypothetical protein
MSSAAAGALILVFDVNFLQAGATAPLQALTDNMISYLAAPQSALIVHDGTLGIEADALANLTTHLTAHGIVVTANVGLPGGSISNFRQIWDIRYDNSTPLSAGDITAYVNYMAGGGSLFVIGENAGFMTRNNSLIGLVQAAGGGTITLSTPSSTETAVPPFNGPSALSSLTFLAASGAAYPSGTASGRLITADGTNRGAAIVWGPGQMSSAAAGALILVFDVNFLQAGATAPLQALTDNIISYLAAPVPVNGTDFNADGKPDILWHNQVNGSLYVWLMNGVARTGGGLLPDTVSPDWQVRGVADFNGDGKLDILWHNQTSGLLFVWFMNGTTRTGGAYLSPSSVSTDWQIGQVVDFNGDGKPDILWHNQTDGTLYVWLMNGTARTAAGYLPDTVSTDWQIRGGADFNGDGKPDILWHNQTSGLLFVWFMNGTMRTGGAYLSPSSASTDWQIGQVVDFNGDGKPDILWHNQTDGTLYVWLMNGTARTGGGYLPDIVSADWQIRQ